MTTIRTTCPTCGEVDMAPQAIMLSIRDQAGEGSYRFACPSCRHTIEKPADRKVVALLLSAGVELEPEDSQTERAPDMETIEPRPSGPQLTVDDLIAFHFLLADDAELYRYLPKA